MKLNYKNHDCPFTRNKIFKSLGLGLGASVLVLAEVSAVYAESMLEEIVVTARKRDETLFDVPVAVSAVSAEDLATFSITDMRDLQTFSPGLLMERGGSGGGGKIAIRGISTETLQSGFDQSVSIAVDGVQVGRARALTVGLLDVHQVEVLRGPQALFFGKNSPAGVISVRSANPTEELEGYIRSSYEFEADGLKVDAAISGPLSGNWGARLAVSFRDMDGYYKNSQSGPYAPGTHPFSAIEGDPVGTGPDESPEEDSQVRLTLAYDSPDADLSAILKVNRSEFESGGPGVGRGCFAGPNGGQQPSIGLLVPGLIDTDAECNHDNTWAVGAFTPGSLTLPHAKAEPYEETTFDLMSLEFNYKLGDWTLTSLSGYYDIETDGFNNFAGTTFSALPSYSFNRFESFSQEFRLTSNLDGPVNFLFGTYYQKSNQTHENSTKLFPFGPDPVDGLYQTWYRVGQTDGETLSAFGQVIWDINDSLEFSVGARYTDEQKDSSLEHTQVHALAIPVAFAAPVGEVFADKFNDSNVSPEATLTWRPADNVMTYVAYKTGFKSGGMGLSQVLFGYNPGFTPDQRDDYIGTFTFDSEEVEGYEIGIKASLLGNQMSLATNIYSYEYDDLQVTTFDAVTSTFGIENAAAVTVEGIETEIVYKVSESLRLNGSLNFNDSTYDSFFSECYQQQSAAQGCLPNGTWDRSGDSTPLAPQITGVLGFTWNGSFNNGIGLQLSTNARYSDEYETHTKGDPRTPQESYWTYNAAIRFFSSDSTWEMAVLGRNLSDELYTTRVDDKPLGEPGTGELFAAYQRGRQFAVEVRYNF